jgi:hypothetical protein
MAQALHSGAPASRNRLPEGRIHGCPRGTAIQRICSTVLALGLFGTGCGDEPAGPVDTDLEMVYWSGDGQVGPCYSELLDPVVVRILDGR